MPLITTMIYKRFGKTELSMPVLSFGCMRSMHDWKDSPLKEIPAAATQKLETIVTAALENGINHIETSHGYGSSERQLGTILRKIPRKEFLLQTKVVPEEDCERFENKVLASMERLQVERLDLLAIHGINDHRTLWQSCRKNGCLSAARCLQDKGLVDHIGFSGHGPAEVIKDALNHEEDGGFDYVNIHWYFIFQTNDEALETAAEKDIGVFIISPSDKGGYLHTPSELMKELCMPLSPMLFNDLFCLRNEAVNTISVGASEPFHFEEHLKVLPFLEQHNYEAFTIIEKRLRAAMYSATGVERPDEYWHKLPPWERSPGNVNLRMISWLLHLHEGWELKQYARDRYQKLGAGSNWVPGNNGMGIDKIDCSTLDIDADLTHADLKKMIEKAHVLLSDPTNS